MYYFSQFSLNYIFCCSYFFLRFLHNYFNVSFVLYVNEMEKNKSLNQNKTIQNKEVEVEEK